MPTRTWRYQLSEAIAGPPGRTLTRNLQDSSTLVDSVDERLILVRPRVESFNYRERYNINWSLDRYPQESLSFVDNLDVLQPGTTLHQNEPAGYTQLAVTPFDEVEPDDWYVYQTYNGQPTVAYTIQTDGDAPLSPSNVGRWRFPVKDQAAGTSLTLSTLRNPTSGDWDENPRRVYIEFAIMASSNYRNHETGVVKLHWVNGNTGGGGDPYFFRTRSDSFDPTGPFYWAGHLQHSNLENRSFGHNLKGSNQMATRGQWYHIEIIIVMNSEAEVADGEFHMWIDNDKHSEFTDVEWSDGSGGIPNWQYFRWMPLWGGQNDSIPEEFYIYIDHTYISGAESVA